MRWLDLPRVPEPEVMEDAGEVGAYSSAAADDYLSRIDDSFVAHALRLIGERRAAGGGRGLDIGCGPGQIVRKLAQRLPGWELVGVDRSPAMIRRALADAGPAWAERLHFLLADGKCLPFPEASFDLVTCNSVLHHLEQPELLLREIARVARGNGAILVRDLRRPSRLAFPVHVRWHGRHYRGLMYKLYRDSVRAAYRRGEIAALLEAAPLPGTRLFTRGRTHLGIERPAS